MVSEGKAARRACPERSEAESNWSQPKRAKTNRSDILRELRRGMSNIDLSCVDSYTSAVLPLPRRTR